MKNLWLNPFILLTSMLIFSAPAASREPPEPKDSGDPLIAKGRELFFRETFDGNGRTCGTCHRAENNLTLDPEFIATLPDDDPLFVAEYVPALMENFENPKLMREFGLIMVNADGFDDLPSQFTMRSVPHVFAQKLSMNSPQGQPHTGLGWSGDGAPDDGSLRSFATGAVRQHFTKTTQRREGVDFRLPTDEELDALEAFQLSLGRQEELALPLPLKSEVALQGQDIFQNEGQCSFCHVNAGANNALDDSEDGNLNFNTGVEDMPDQPRDLSGEFYPPDDGAGTPGNGEFNTPSLVEAADTPPFFHNNSAKTLEEAVEFYNTRAFTDSPAAQRVNFENLDAEQIVAVSAFLRVINALHNIREVNTMLGAVSRNEYLGGEHPNDLVKRAVFDIDDAIKVLSDSALHPKAITFLKKARGFTLEAANKPASRIKLARKAIANINNAKRQLIK
jgi:hypothetical protein